MDFINDKIEQYCVAHSDAESALLKRINRETHLEELKPRMLSGHFQGRVLAMLSGMIQPKKVLEIGTYTGYSAICLAEGLAEGGKLTTIDKNEELEHKVRGYFHEAGISDKVDYIIGNAIEVIPTLSEPFDLVFIDADKESYRYYYDHIIDNVKKGGYIIVDNVLWSGKVIDPDKQDKPTRAIKDFNTFVKEDQRVERIMLPIRDGLLVIKKK